MTNLSNNTTVDGGIKSMKDNKDLLNAIVVAVIGAAFSVGVIYKTVTSSEAATKAAIDTNAAIASNKMDEITKSFAEKLDNTANVFSDKLELTVQLFKSELALRDLKINKAYESASQGSRYTAEMAREHEKQADSRHFEINDRVGDLEHLCTETRKRLDKIEDAHADTIGLHHNNLGK